MFSPSVVFLCLLFVVGCRGGASEGNNLLGCRLHSDLISHAGMARDNIVLSPYSLFLALSMLLEGAPEGPATRSELLSAMGISGVANSDLRSANFQFVSAMRATKHTFFGNGIWLNSRYGIDILLPAFLQTLQESYGASAESVDFPEPGTSEINDWVANATRGMIQDFLPPLDEDVISVLVNALYFNHSWQTPFEETETKPSQFALIDESEYDGSWAVQMMNAEFETGEGVLFGEHKWGTSLSMAYQTQSEVHAGIPSQFRMVLLLPSSNSMAGFSKILDAASHDSRFLNQVVSEQDFPSRESDTLKVKLPKFTLEIPTTSLVDSLKRMEVHEVFSDEARLDLIADPGVLRLYVSDILQKAKIVVHEKGTEAAAATAIVMTEATSWHRPPPPRNREFYAHRPFAFFLQHVPSGIVLFQGQAMNPSKTEVDIEVWIRDYWRAGLSWWAWMLIAVAIVAGLTGIVVGSLCLCCMWWHRKNRADEGKIRLDDDDQDVDDGLQGVELGDEDVGDGVFVHALVTTPPKEE